MSSLKFSQILAKKSTFVILSNYFLQAPNTKLSKYFSTLTNCYFLLIVSWLKLTTKEKKKDFQVHIWREKTMQVIK
jgi:hypothetical protein